MYLLNICHLYPDIMNLYGARGNITALVSRCRWRDIEAKVFPVSIGDPFDPDCYDLVFIGGGLGYEQEIVRDDLVSHKGEQLKPAIEEGLVFLAICGGYQLLGKYLVTYAGKKIEFLGALDFYTVEDRKRMTGNFVFECDFLKSQSFDGLVVGFENHRGKTYLGPSILPLGKVLKGYGNNGEDGFEGARYKNVFCSYSHGCLLPKNPALADYIIETALKRKYGDGASLELIDDRLENAARNAALERVIRK